MGDGKFILVGVGGALVIGIGIAALLKKLGKGISGAIPQVVKDGAEAGVQLAKLGGNAVVHPLDTFGIAPGVDANGVPNWTQTVPWATPAYNPDPAQQPAPQVGSLDPVSNNDAGVNYNLF